MSHRANHQESERCRENEDFALIQAALKRRGLVAEAAGSVDPALEVADGFIDEWYGLLLKYSFRLFLRDLIKNRRRARLSDLARYCGSQVAKRYLGFLERAGVTMKKGRYWQLHNLKINSFGPTLEWLVAEVLRRDFGAVAVSSVRLCRPSLGGDYDIIALAEGRCLYIETKSAPPRQLDNSQVRAFVQRVLELAPDLAILLSDTHLRMADKIIPMVSEALQAVSKTRRGGRKPRHLVRLSGETFHAGKRLFITNSHPDLRTNLMSCLAAHWRQGFRAAESSWE